MPFRKPSPRRLRSLCAEVHPDDGSDPRFFPRAVGSRKEPTTRARQLCRQVAEVLDGALADCSGEACLRDLGVVGVEPAPDGSRLLATLAPRVATDPVDPRAVLTSLDRAAGWLRSEVAAAITRKRAPLLVYRVVEIRPATSAAIENP